MLGEKGVALSFGDLPKSMELVVIELKFGLLCALAVNLHCLAVLAWADLSVVVVEEEE